MTGRWMVEGAVGATIGAGILSVWFLLYDMAEGQPLRTPALLGAALLHGLRDVGALQITLRLVVEYSLVHSAAVLVFGCAVAGLLLAAPPARVASVHFRRVVVPRRSWLFSYHNAWPPCSFPGSSSRGAGTKRGPGRCHG